MHNFNTEQEFLDAVEGTWRNQPLAPDVLGPLKAGVREADIAMREASSATDGSLNLRLKGWVLTFR